MIHVQKKPDKPPPIPVSESAADVVIWSGHNSRSQHISFSPPDITYLCKWEEGACFLSWGIKEAGRDAAGRRRVETMSQCLQEILTLEKLDSNLDFFCPTGYLFC